MLRAEVYNALPVHEHLKLVLPLLWVMVLQALVRHRGPIVLDLTCLCILFEDELETLEQA